MQVKGVDCYVQNSLSPRVLCLLYVPQCIPSVWYQMHISVWVCAGIFYF